MMLNNLKKAGAICAVLASSIIGLGGPAMAEEPFKIYQGPSQPVAMEQFIQGVWYTESGESKQFHLFNETGEWEMASYMDFDEEPFLATGSYTLEKLDSLLYKLTVSVDLPDQDLVIPDTVIVGQDMKSIVSVETGGIYMRVEDKQQN